MSNGEVDGKYYQIARPGSLADRLVVRARDAIYADFIRRTGCTASDTILDVGISDVVGESANMLERLHPHQAKITAVGIGTAEAFQEAFPAVTYRQIVPNTTLPFADKTFDIATSNAVVEHVGSPEHQRLLISEMLRVARRVYVTVPNRFFPVEHHTGIPLLHYWDASFALACRLTGKTEWADPTNLILMSTGKLRAVWPPGGHVEIGMTGLPLVPFSSSVYGYVDQG